MKIFKLMAIALVAMLGFTACEKDCDHDFIEVDHSKDLVGTWTCMEANYAEALVINADGSVLSTGVEDGEYWENIKGNIKTINNKMTLTFEDGDNYEGRFEMICGEAFTIFDVNGDHLTYRYCENDLADEVVGMWVCTYVPWMDADMAVNVYQADGKAFFTGFVGNVDFDYAANVETTYTVIGDLMFQSNPMSYEGAPQYLVFRLDYSPNGSELGDVLTNTNLMAFGDEVFETTASMFRIRQTLDLAGKKYDYIKTFVSNVKGEDKDIDFMGYTFNFAKMDGSGLDKMLKSLLFAVEFPDANTLGYSYQMNGNKETYNSPIVVEGNKMTIKMSDKVATLKDVVLYAFQDADCSQMHFYMHKTAFVNFYTNMQAMLMEATDEQFDINNAEAVNAIYNEINNAVETINVSLVMSK